MKIELTDITKTYGSGAAKTVALDGVSLTVERGEFVAVMGPSGCGKSTLLSIIGLLDSPTSGSYRLDGLEMAYMKERWLTALRRGRFGFVFQSFNLIDSLTVRRNIMLPLNCLDMTRAERDGRVDEIMERLGIAHRSEHYPSQLSGGQQQRVAIARAVVTEPDMILADEPTGNLDSRNGAEVMALLDDLHRRGSTIVMVTHSPKDAAMADRIINLFDGKVIESLSHKL